MAIVGGRNLGDEYFDAKPELNFTDIDLLGAQLAPDLQEVSPELLMISAYFVPTGDELIYLTTRADHSVDIRLLTNSLEVTDVPAVHGGYAAYRVPLLEHGVRLFEMRRQGDRQGSG
ncbi:hypothetical protein GCM10027514_35780 [Azotobacter armeniacus]